jgi:glucose/arabinose dehydrogenase
MARRPARLAHALALLAALAVGAAAPGWSHAAATIALVPVATGLSRPTAIVHAGDGSGRLFIAQQGGQVLVFAGGAVRPTPFLSIAALISCCGERGLLGLAFHPDYEENGAFFVLYTNPAGSIVLARYLVSGGDPNVANPASGTILLTIPHPDHSNHNGGQLAFGPDGHLYAGIGDGGGGGDPDSNAQNRNVLLGKILRIAVGPAGGYSIPAGNPFAGVPGSDEIWALGLRNPFRFSFDRLTGDLFIGDVGQNAREEIDFQPASSGGGENYCWPNREGFSIFDPDRPCTGGGTPTPPILDYSHALGCSVTGGYRYRGAVYPGLVGTYLYGDFCSGRIWGATNDGGGWTTRQLLDTPFNLSTFGEDEAGELYVAHYAAAGAVIHRIVSQKAVTGVDVYRPATGQWLLRSADGELTLVAWGAAGVDVAVPANYDEDGVRDVAVYRPTTGEWFIRRSTDAGLTHLAWGAPTLGDVPVPADYDGDQKADVAVYRRTTGEWFIRRSTDTGLTHLAWGAPTLGDVPVPADYDGDGKADIAVYRPTVGEWFIRLSTNGSLRHQPWGAPALGDTPVPEDYDGDGKADIAVYRTTAGQWLIQTSSTQALVVVPWGMPALGDRPVPARYDPDAAAEIAVYRTATGEWWIRHAADAVISVVPWGSSALGDVPLRRPAVLR